MLGGLGSRRAQRAGADMAAEREIPGRPSSRSMSMAFLDQKPPRALSHADKWVSYCPSFQFAGPFVSCLHLLDVVGVLSTAVPHACDPLSLASADLRRTFQHLICHPNLGIDRSAGVVNSSGVL